MPSPLLVLKSPYKSMVDWIFVFAGLIAAYVFIAHGFSAIFQSDQYRDITAYVGMSGFWGMLFMKGVGIVDIIVGILLFIHPAKVLLLWGSIWVLVPLYLQYVVQGQLEIVAKMMFWVAVAIMFSCARWMHIRKKQRLV